MASREFETTRRLMGAKVAVFKKMERDEDEERLIYWKSVPVKPSVIGWVTGIRWKQIGYYHSGGPGSTVIMKFDPGEPEEYEEPYFEQKKTVPVLLVTVKPTTNPIFVPFDGFREVQTRDHEHEITLRQTDCSAFDRPDPDKDNFDLEKR